MSVEIQLREGQLLAGGTLAGAVLVDLDQPLENKGVFLSMRAAETNSWTEAEGAGAPVDFAAKTDILSQQTQLYKGGLLQAGLHEFPFRIALPNTLPGSLDKVRNIEGALGSVVYTLRASVNRGFLKFPLEARETFHVHEKFTGRVAPATAKLEGSSSPLDLKLLVDKNVQFPGEPLTFQLRLRNNSERPIDTITAALVQRVTLRASTPHAREKVISHVVYTENFRWKVVAGSCQTCFCTMMMPETLSTDVNGESVRLAHEFVASVAAADETAPQVGVSVPVQVLWQQPLSAPVKAVFDKQATVFKSATMAAREAEEEEEARTAAAALAEAERKRKHKEARAAARTAAKKVAAAAAAAKAGEAAAPAAREAPPRVRIDQAQVCPSPPTTPRARPPTTTVTSKARRTVTTLAGAGQDFPILPDDIRKTATAMLEAHLLETELQVEDPPQRTPIGKSRSTGDLASPSPFAAKSVAVPAERATPPPAPTATLPPPASGGRSLNVPAVVTSSTQAAEASSPQPPVASSSGTRMVSSGTGTGPITASTGVSATDADQPRRLVAMRSMAVGMDESTGAQASLPLPAAVPRVRLATPPALSSFGTQTVNTENAAIGTDNELLLPARPKTTTLPPLERQTSLSTGIQASPTPAARRPPKTAPRKLRRTQSAKALQPRRQPVEARVDPYVSVLAAFRWRRDFTAPTVSSSLKRSKSDYQLFAAGTRQYAAREPSEITNLPPTPQPPGTPVAAGMSSVVPPSIPILSQAARISSQIGVDRHSRSAGQAQGLRKSRSMPGSSSSLPPLTQQRRPAAAHAS